MLKARGGLEEKVGGGEGLDWARERGFWGVLGGLTD